MDGTLSRASSIELESSHCIEKAEGNLMLVEVSVDMDKLRVRRWDVSITLVGELGTIGTQMQVQSIYRNEVVKARFIIHSRRDHRPLLWLEPAEHGRGRVLGAEVGLPFDRRKPFSQGQAKFGARDCCFSGIFWMEAEQELDVSGLL